ncbi:MAG TPA: phosphoribosylanthranilate isomerase [Thermoanaerobaculia bacterium]|nr:phosphoribosylanthranilate isomerase [Thermoanaerobaculia bacterium]
MARCLPLLYGIMEIKICGITRVEDAIVAVEEGASFLGLIFVPGSPRCVTPQQARLVASAARSCESAGDAGVKIVGVFRDQTTSEIAELVTSVPLDLVQLHGSESEEQVRSVSVPVIKAISIDEDRPVTDGHPSAHWLLFDTLDRAQGGGTGKAFDWSLLSSVSRTRPFFLAGGINADNVASAVRQARPDGIDVSSGVESSPGIKDRDKIRDLFERIRRG